MGGCRAEYAVCPHWATAVKELPATDRTRFSRRRNLAGNSRVSSRPFCPPNRGGQNGGHARSLRTGKSLRHLRRHGPIIAARLIIQAVQAVFPAFGLGDAARQQGLPNGVVGALAVRRVAYLSCDRKYLTE